MSEINNLVTRAVVTGKVEDRPLRNVQAVAYADDLRDEVEHFEPYGFTSSPDVGAEAIIVAVAGEIDNSIVVNTPDRRYRPRDLKTKEVCIYDDLGRKVYLSRDGIRVEGVDSPVTVKTSARVDIDAPDVYMTGNLHVTGDIIAGREIKDAGGSKSMSGMRSTFDNHVHRETQTVTEKPDEAM